jgi:hypothetical protein
MNRTFFSVTERVMGFMDSHSFRPGKLIIPAISNRLLFIQQQRCAFEPERPAEGFLLHARSFFYP